MTPRDLAVQRKRALGWTYKTIDQHFGLPTGKAWIICNRPRQRENSKDSKTRWVARGGKALVDTPHA